MCNGTFGTSHVCHFEGMVNQPELQLSKANTTDTEVTFLDLHLSIANGFASSKIYDKRDDFYFDIIFFSVFGRGRSWCIHFATY